MFSPPAHVWELLSHCASVAEPLRLSCVPEKPLNGLAVLFPSLEYWAIQGKKAIHLIAPAATSVGLGLPPDLFQNTSVDSFLEQTPCFTACPTPRTLSSLISSLPHIWAFLSFASLVTCTLLPQKPSALSDFCLPHPWWAFGCSTSSTGHKWSKKGIKRANPVTLIPTPPSLCFDRQMGLKGTKRYQMQVTSLLWITSRKTYGVVVGSSQKQPRCFSSAGTTPQVVLQGWKWGSTQQLGTALCMGMNSKVTRNAEALGVTHKGWLCQMSWEHLAESRHKSHIACGKNISPKVWKETNFLQTILFLQYQQIVLKKYTSSFRKIHLTCSFSWEMFPSPKWMQTDANMSEAVKNWKIFMGNGSPKEIHPRLTLKLNDGKKWCQWWWLSWNTQPAHFLCSCHCSCYLSKGRHSWFSLPGYQDLPCLSQDTVWHFYFIIQ